MKILRTFYRKILQKNNLQLSTKCILHTGKHIPYTCTTLTARLLISWSCFRKILDISAVKRFLLHYIILYYIILYIINKNIKQIMKFLICIVHLECMRTFSYQLCTCLQNLKDNIKNKFLYDLQ